MNKNLLAIIALMLLPVQGLLAQNTEGIYINEILSNPPKGATYDDWFEIYNANSTAKSLKGWVIKRIDTDNLEKQYNFTETIAAKGYLTIEKAVSFGIGKGGGDKLILYNASGVLVDSVTVPKLGGGKTYGRVPDGGRTWFVFDEPTKGASNGNDDPMYPTEDSSLKGKLYINEVVSNPLDTDADWIEIYNASDAAVSLGGLALEDDNGVLTQFVIPNGTTIAAHGFKTYTQGEKGDLTTFTFGLSAKGETVYLVDAQNKLIDKVTLPNMKEAQGSSYARTVDAGSEWAVTASPTKNTSNGTSGINDIRVDAAKDQHFYNLQGMRVDHPTKGVYIHAGKKVVVK